MGTYLDHFSIYVREYAMEYMELNPEQLDAIQPESFVSAIEERVGSNARFVYLQLFGWAISDRMYDHYLNTESCRIFMRKAAKVFSVMAGDFILYNDYETQHFVAETLEPLAAFQHNIRTEPFSATLADCLHFVDNFIAWYKRSKGIPLKLW